jgi:hypothetical protein
MKKFLTLALGLVLFVSCSGDDNDNVIDATKLTNKKWYFASYKVAGQTVPYENQDASCGRDYNEFLSTGVLIDGYFNNCELFTSQGSWVLDGDKISVSMDGEIGTATIKSLTATSLELETVGDFDDNGTDETIRAIFTSN